MPTMVEVRERLAALGIPALVRGSLGTELMGIAQAMADHERMTGVAVGEWQGRKAVLAVTEARVIFAGRGVPMGETLVIPLAKVKEVAFSAGLFSGQIEINGQRLEKVGPGLVKPFVTALNQARTEPGAATAPAGSGDIAGELGRLAALRDTGVLTAEEFAAAKAKVLR